jgi:hypothetical protein
MWNGGLKRTASVLVCLVALAGVAGAGPLQDDLKARRARAMEKLGPDTIAIFWSAPPRVYSADVNYEYRQDSNLLYLTGIDQEATILVLMPGSKTRREVLFVREADARREHWTVHSLTPAEATAQSGVEAVLTANQFQARRRRAVGEQGPIAPGAARASAQPHRSARPRAPVRGADARALLRIPGAGRHAGAQRAAADQDALRAGGAQEERADFERGAPGRHARRRAAQIRVRGGGGDRRGLPS